MTAQAPTTDQLIATARSLAERLRRAGLQLAVAESCTGGLIGHVLTELPRASDHFLGSVVSYSNLLKRDLLAVDVELLDRTGAVSPEVAEAMARGLLARWEEADLAISVTGIAGPDGGSAEKPVGLTYVAVVRRAGAARVERRVWSFDRAGNKRASALLALKTARDLAGAR